MWEKRISKRACKKAEKANNENSNNENTNNNNRNIIDNKSPLSGCFGLIAAFFLSFPYYFLF